MLAVGILFENWFPQYVVVTGDYGREHAERIVAWAESVLDRPLALPIVVDGPRLWLRMQTLYPDRMQWAVRRFLALSAGHPSQAWCDLFRCCPDQAALHDRFVEELAGFDRLQQFGAVDLVTSLCCACPDIGLVIDWVRDVLEPDGKPRFALEDLLHLLCDHFVTVPPDEQEVLQVFRPPPDGLANIFETFLLQMVRMAGLREPSDVYFDETSLLHQFAERCPEAEAAFRNLIRRKTAEYRQGLKQMREDADAFIARREQQEAHVPFDPTAFQAQQMMAGHAEASADLLRDEIERQRRHTTDREPVARQMAEAMRKALKMSGTLRDDVQKADRHGLLHRIFAASWREGFALTREAWKAIEREATVDELRCLTLLARTPLQEDEFCHWREHLMESPDLWPLMVDVLQAD